MRWPCRRKLAAGELGGGNLLGLCRTMEAEGLCKLACCMGSN